MKKWMCVCVTAMLAVSALAGCSGRSGSSDAAAQTTKAGMETRTEADTKADTKAETKGQAGTGETSDPEGQAGDGWISSEDLQAAAGEHHVKITVRDYGTISVTLDGDKAPITVANYLKLAKDGFYDGLTFHRIIDGFRAATPWEPDWAVPMRKSRESLPATAWRTPYPTQGAPYPWPAHR